MTSLNADIRVPRVPTKHRSIYKSLHHDVLPVLTLISSYHTWEEQEHMKELDGKAWPQDKLLHPCTERQPHIHCNGQQYKLQSEPFHQEDVQCRILSPPWCRCSRLLRSLLQNNRPVLHIDKSKGEVLPYRRRLVQERRMVEIHRKEESHSGRRQPGTWRGLGRAW